MSALFWYNCVASISIIIAALVVYKKRNLLGLSDWLVFYLFASGLTWIGEFIVLGLFNSYAYKPGVFENIWAENLLGHLILNTTIWPCMAVLVVAYRLGYGWISLITAGILLIEYLFLKAGIYEHHWWRYYMTGLALIINLTILKLWFPLMNKVRHGLPRFTTLYFAAFVIIHLPAPLLLLGGQQYYSSAVTDDMIRSSIIFILSYHLVETFVVMYLFYLDKWFWKVVPFVISCISQIFLASNSILIIQNEWKLTYTLLLYVITLTICLLMEKYTLRPLTKSTFRKFSSS